MQKISKNVLTGILICQFAVGSAVPRGFAAEQAPQGESALGAFVREGTEDFSSIAARNHLNEAAREIESATEGQLPSKIRDVFHLTQQVTEVYSEEGTRTYQLASIQDSAPTIVAPDFDRDVQIEIDSEGKGIALKLMVGDVVKARHLIQGFEPVTFARDRELLVFLDRSGKLYAIDMGYAKAEAFRTPLPTIELVDTKIPADRMASLKAAFLSRGLKPLEARVREGAITPLDKSMEMTAGDFVIYSEAPGERTIEGLFDRSVMATQVATAEGTLATLSFAVAPAENAESVLKDLATLQKNTETRQDTAQVSEQMDAAEKAALARISPEAIAALMARAKRNSNASGETRDRFAIEEWEKHFQDLHQQAVEDLAKAQPGLSNVEVEQIKDWKAAHSRLIEPKSTPLTVFQKVMKSSSIRMIAWITASAGVLAGAEWLRQGNGPESLAWLVHYLNIAYENYWPEVLKDAAYRVTLLKSSLALATFIPLTWGAGKLLGKLRGNDWDAWKNIAASGMRIYAAIILPFHHRLAQLTRQSNFIRALQLGINPLVKVTPESEVGKALGLTESVRPGVVNPLQGKDAFQRELEHKEKVLKALAEQKTRAKALTWKLALLVASGKSKVDPATLMLIATKGSSFNLNELNKLAENPEFIKQWEALAEELQFTFRKAEPFGLTADISKVLPDEVAAYYELAKSVAHDIDRRSAAQNFIAKMRMKWHGLSQNLLLGLGNFGVEEYRFLKSAEPSQRDVVGQFSKSFQTDYFLGVAQMGVLGDRAELSHPEALAADEKGPLWTNRGHLADMADQIRIYGINVPSSLALVYQRSFPVREGAYDPVETESLKGEQKSEGFFKGMLEWGKGAMNIAQADYGGIWKRDLIKRIRTMQASLLMVVGARIAFAGQPFADAIAAYGLMMVWANWQFGWIWTPVNRGNQLYQDRLEGLANEFSDAKAKLGRGLRLSETHTWMEGYKDLLALYEKAGAELPSEFERNATQAIQALNDIDVEKLEIVSAEANRSREAMTSLRDALLSGDAARIRVARTELQQLYLNSISPATEAGRLTREAILHLNAMSLLEHSLKTPPFAVAPHPKVEWMTILTAAVVTTYLYTSLAVISFGTNVDWAHMLTHYGALSVALYGAAFGIQKFANWVVHGDNWKRFARAATLSFTLLTTSVAQADVAEAKEASYSERLRSLPAIEAPKAPAVPVRVKPAAALVIGCESAFL